MTFFIRRANPEDFPAMQEVAHAALRELAVRAYPIEQIDEAIETGAWTLQRSLIDTGSYFVAVKDDGVMGGVGWDREWLGNADTEMEKPEIFASLRSMFVSPRGAGAGIGGRLLKHCIADIEKSGVKVIELYASFNAEAFYERHGFRTLCTQSLVLASGIVMKGSRMRRTTA